MGNCCPCPQENTIIQNDFAKGVHLLSYREIDVESPQPVVAAPFKLRVSDYAHRYAYIIGYPDDASDLEQIENIEEHLESFKNGLLWLGFQKGIDSIKLFEGEASVPDMSKENERI